MLDDCFIINTFLEYINTRGISSSQAYTTSLQLENTVIEGFAIGQTDARELMSFKSCTWKNRNYNIDIGEQPHLYNGFVIDSPTFESVEHDAVSGPNNLLPPAVNIRLGDGSVDLNPPAGIDFDNLWKITNLEGKELRLYENYAAPANAVMVVGIVNAKAVEQGVVTPPTNNPPVVSAITADPPDVDPNTPGVQEYESTTVTYSATATDADVGDAVSWAWTYSINGGAEVPISQGTGAVQPVIFQYPAGARTYVWKLTATDSKGATASSTLTVQIIAPPVTPPPDCPPPASLKIIWSDGKTYTYQLVQ